MKAESWDKVKEIFLAVVEIEPGERALFLNSLCDGDDGLRREVESLLVSHGEAGSLYESPALNLPTALKIEYGDFSGRVGAYRIESEIGRGGMGAVYLATRDDDQFIKQVAIKFIRHTADNREAVRRFRDERQILAALEHPNIAHLLDGGETEDGSPYLVMEYVEGMPLLDFCNERQLLVDERLKLFLKICGAAHYAHQHLIIHRDLKPSNILVTEAGDPKLLDFGIAKLLNPELRADAKETVPAQRLLTPEYASPEQIRGEAISTASDVYLLGVILYELLTGTSPFELKNKRFDEIARIISETNPPRPSSVVGKETGENKQKTTNNERKTNPKSQILTSKSLVGDLDNIILMAMRKEPARRYKSVEQFAEDVRRHLNGLPVIARQDTFAYRAEKFIKRNRIGAAAAAIILLAILSGLAATLWQASVARAQSRIAAEQRDRARTAQIKAERINQFLQRMLGAAAPENQGREVKVVEVLENAERQAQIELADQPEILAAVLHTIGSTYNNLVKFEAAEKNYRAALELNRQFYGGNDRATALCLVALADLLLQTKRPREAEPLLREAIEIERRFVPESHRELARAMAQLGRTEREKGDDRAAEPILQEAIAVAAEFENGEGDNTLFALNEIALIRNNAFDFRGMAEIYRRAIPILRKRPQQKAILGTALANFGIALLNEHNLAEAEPALLESLAVRREIYGETNLAVAHTLSVMGRLRLDQKRYAEAQADSEKALDIQKKTLSPNHPLMAMSLGNLGNALTRQNRMRLGETYLRQALEINSKVYRSDDYRISNLESQLGECLLAQRRFAEAEPLLIVGYEKLRDKIGGQAIFTTKALLRLVEFYEQTVQPDKAASYRKLLPPT